MMIERHIIKLHLIKKIFFKSHDKQNNIEN